MKPTTDDLVKSESVGESQRLAPPTTDLIATDLTVGELTFEEDTSGGLGRHLGVFSTTFLM